MKTLLLALALLVLGCAQRAEVGPAGSPGAPGEEGPSGLQGPAGATGARGPAGQDFELQKIALVPVEGFGALSDGSGVQTVVEARCPGPELTLLHGGCWAGTPGDVRVDSATATLSASGPVDAWDPAEKSGWHCAARGLAVGERLEATAVCFDPRGTEQ